MIKINRTKVKKILFITLSNIGDVILTLPVLGALKSGFPAASVTVLTGSASGGELFEADPAVSEIIVYDKRAPLLERLRLGLRLRKDKFDLAVDLRNSIFPFLAGARYATPFSSAAGSGLHMRDRHLRKLEKLGLAAASAPFPINLSAADKARVKSLLDSLGVSPSDKIIAISAGAKSHTKRWPAKGFIGLCGRIWGELGAKILLIGDKNDAAINKEIFSAGIKGAHDVTGRTGLRELLHLLSLCRLLVTNDSAPLHAASAVGLPTVAIFGPTSHKKYGPLAPRSVVVHRAMACSPCEQPQCRFGTLACITDIQEAAVWDAVKKVFYGI